jgi:cysteine dioxygenase
MMVLFSGNQMSLHHNIESILNTDCQDKIPPLLSEYYRSNDTSWEPYCFWKSGIYTRNLMSSSNRFEIVIICWDVYTESPIHDHDNKDCWFVVLRGLIQEVGYEFHDDKLVQDSTRIYESGHVSATGIQWHKMSSLSDKTITLHIYSKPIEYCSIYCPDTDQITRVKNSYHSKYGLIQKF